MRVDRIIAAYPGNPLATNPARPARAAIVCTLRAAAPVVDSFIRYHLALGFAHIFLFFDDPLDPAIDIAARHGAARVSVIRDGQELFGEWRKCAQFPHFVPHLSHEVMARQCLNVEVAVQLALARGYDWLLHIDADELFHCPGQDAGDHFARLAASGVERAVYPNLEALPEAIEVTDWFRQATLFKVNRNLLPGGRFSPAQAGLAARFAQFPHNFFLFYSNGKSAARLRPGLVPDGVHRFSATMVPRAGQSAARLPPIQEHVIADCRILHYACIGFSNFVVKYRILGRFGDRWFDRVPITDSISDFHTAARDVIASGTRQQALDFYRGRAMIEDPHAIATLIRAGLLLRVPGPAQWLNGEVTAPA